MVSLRIDKAQFPRQDKNKTEIQKPNTWTPSTQGWDTCERIYVHIFHLTFHTKLIAKWQNNREQNDGDIDNMSR